MTDSPAPLRVLTCPTCGAPLDVNPDDVVLKCKYCSSVIENPIYSPPPPPAPEITITIPEAPVHIHQQPQSRPSSKLGCITITVFGILLTLFILGINWLGNPNSGFASIFSFEPIFPLQVHTPVIAINSNGTPNLIGATYDVSKKSYALSRLDIVSHKTLWTIMGKKDSLRIDALVAGDTLVYAVMGNRLVALRLEDGKQAWEASLPDRPVCKRCILLMKGQVIALTSDHSLGAYDAMTGHQTWEKHFETTGYTLYPAGDGVALLYGINIGAALGVFDVATGSEATHIEPTCAPGESPMEDEMEFLSNVLIDTSAQPAKAYILYGLFNACVQRWDLSSGQKDWEYAETDQNLDSSREIPVQMQNGILYYVQDHQLRSLDAATGQHPQTLDEPRDYSLIPLLVDGQRLVVRAKRTRGSARYELWGYDLSSGKKLWQKPLINSLPIDPPEAESGLIHSEESAWTYTQTPDGLWLITFQTQPNQVNLALIDLDTGELTRQTSVALGIGDDADSYSVPEHVASQDTLDWFAMESKVYTIDLPAGAFSYRWP